MQSQASIGKIRAKHCQAPASARDMRCGVRTSDNPVNLTVYSFLTFMLKGHGASGWGTRVTPIAEAVESVNHGVDLVQESFEIALAPARSEPLPVAQSDIKPGDAGYLILKDKRLKNVQWIDLVKVSKWQAFVEVTLSVPWTTGALAAYWYAQHSGQSWWSAVAIFCCFYVFLTGLRQAHNAFHYSVGIPRWGCEALMTYLSVVMTGSMHAVQLNHLHHHRHNLSKDDVEGFTALLPWWQAMAVGPYFALKLHWFAFKIGKPANLRWVGIDLAANLLLYAAAAWLYFGYHQWWLAVYVITMWIGQCGTGFFAVWTVHHGCDNQQHIARTQRGWLKNLISYQMFHHIEHHLFPAVPTCHWAKLGARIDEALPDLRTKSVY